MGLKKSKRVGKVEVAFGRVLEKLGAMSRSSDLEAQGRAKAREGKVRRAIATVGLRVKQRIRAVGERLRPDEPDEPQTTRADPNA